MHEGCCELTVQWHYYRLYRGSCTFFSSDDQNYCSYILLQAWNTLACSYINCAACTYLLQVFVHCWSLTAFMFWYNLLAYLSGKSNCGIDLLILMSEWCNIVWTMLIWKQITRDDRCGYFNRMQQRTISMLAVWNSPTINFPLFFYVCANL
jgi:hypothetical protein